MYRDTSTDSMGKKIKKSFREKVARIPFLVNLTDSSERNFKHDEMLSVVKEVLGDRYFNSIEEFNTFLARKFGYKEK